RLRVDVTDDCAAKVHVTRKIGGCGGRKSRVNVKAIPRRMIVMLGNVHLRVCRRNCTPEANDYRRKYGKQMFHASIIAHFRVPFNMTGYCLVKHRDDFVNVVATWL